MNLKYPNFGVNFKIYPGTGGKKGLEYAKIVERVKDETGAELTVTPQIPDIRLISEKTNLSVIAPYADAVEPGRGMGRILLETIKEAGASGVVISHAELPDNFSEISFKIRKCGEIGLDSAVCVDSIEMGVAIANLKPDSLVFEIPEDIGTIRSITSTRSDIVKNFIKEIHRINPKIKIAVGGGIHNPEDVRSAFDLGADATGCASALIRAKDRYELLKKMAEQVPVK